MSRKLNVTLIIAFGVLIAMANLTGCGGKKKVAEPPKVEQKAPEQKPAPAPQVREQPTRRAEERVESLRESQLETVYFDFDKSDIRSDMRDMMNKNARLLNEFKNVQVRLEGHCDERGTNEYNMALGDRRASSVKQFLMDYGIASSRITTISYGEERPVAMGHSEDSWMKNRRVEFKITAQ